MSKHKVPPFQRRFGDGNKIIEVTLA